VQIASFPSLIFKSKLVVREAAKICPTPCKLTFDLLTLKVVSECPAAPKIGMSYVRPTV